MTGNPRAFMHDGLLAVARLVEMQQGGLFGTHGAPEAIEAELDEVHAIRRIVDQHAGWLERLLGRREAEKRLGAWPARGGDPS